MGHGASGAGQIVDQRMRAHQFNPVTGLGWRVANLSGDHVHIDRKNDFVNFVSEAFYVIFAPN